MGYHRREALIENFMKSEYDIMKLDWASMGYKDVKSCRTSFGRILARLNSPCFCSQHRGVVYLSKPGKYLPKDESKSSLKIGECKLNIAYKKGYLRALLNNFLGESDYDVFMVPWKYLGYQDSQTCYQSIRNEICIYKLTNRMFVCKDGDEVYIGKKISTLIPE